MERVRCFVAIPLPDKVKEKLLPLQEEFAKTGAQMKIVEKGNLHITLAFLKKDDQAGVPLEIINPLSGILEIIANKHEKFILNLGEIIPIPAPRYVRVIAVTLSDQKVVSEIQQEIKKEFSVHGVDALTNPAHITIARLKGPKNREALLAKMRALSENVKCEFLVDRIVFFKSTLTKQGPKYDILKEFLLR